jgi:hypothetical protein
VQHNLFFTTPCLTFALSVEQLLFRLISSFEKVQLSMRFNTEVWLATIPPASSWRIPANTHL